MSDNASDMYIFFSNKINYIMETHHIDQHNINEVGLLYYLSIEEFFDAFYFPVISLNQKEYYGEVNTPLLLALELVSFLDLNQRMCLSHEQINITKIPNILDSGAGLGYISSVLVKTLFRIYNKPTNIHSKERENWINMLKHITLIEINPQNIKLLKFFFGRHCNIINTDYLNYLPSLNEVNKGDKYDIIIGNPPFNINGTIKVPTNNYKNKKDDGKSIWRDFVFHSLRYCLKDNGLLCYFIPSIWLKSHDKSGLFEFILRENRLLKIKCYDNTTTNSIFKGHAQTHCGCFLIQKGGQTNEFSHFSYYLNDFSQCHIMERVPIQSICVLDSIIERKIINKLRTELTKHNIEHKPLLVYKTSTISKKITISRTQTPLFKFKNIQTCVLSNNTTQSNPILKYEYSDAPCPYSGEPKIVLPHGMYGIPFVDHIGEYGISRRDKYVILSKNVKNMDCIAWFLSSQITLFMFENYKYRMGFLEKAGFEWLVDISQLFGERFSLKQPIDLHAWFELNHNECEYIKKFDRKIQI